MWNSRQDKPKDLKRKKRIFAMAAALYVVIGIPVSAAVSYFNGNTKTNYSKEIKNNTLIILKMLLYLTVYTRSMMV